MNHNDLFKTLVKAYYENHFEATINSLLSDESEDKEYLTKVISALCGVDVNNEGISYNEALKEAITNYASDHKIVIKLKECSMECKTEDGKTNCQKVCAFEAIKVDKEKHTTIIDSTKCIECGFCIEACPNKNFMDKVEFLPLMNLLKSKKLSS